MQLNKSILHILKASIPFTVDNTVNQILLEIEDGIDPAVYFNSYSPVNTNQRYFQSGDNLVFNNIYLELPYCFGLGEGAAATHIEVEQIANELLPFLDGSSIYLPYAGAKIPFDGYMESANFSALGDPFRLKIMDLSVPISMVGVPDSLNGLELNVNVFLEIQSNFEIQE